ncbi:MAG: hypothetical protein ACYC64_12660 [Armatimonadota bacterium]
MNRVQILIVVTITSLCLLVALTTTVSAAVKPGDTITITATCSYPIKYGSQTITAQRILTVIKASSAGSLWPRAVYITNGWRRVVSPQGETTYVFYNPMTDGMLVRGFVLDQGQVRLVDGIQTSDGKIVVGNIAYVRVQSPGG